MNLSEIRQRLVKDSGRTDLVVDTISYDDDGADYYIRAGQRFLDDHPAKTPKSRAWLTRNLSSGDTSISLADVRAVLSVFVKEGQGAFTTGFSNGFLTEGTDSPRRLERIPFREFISSYGDVAHLQSEGEKGVPTRYTLGIHRDSSPSTVEEEEHLIIFHPASDGEYSLAVELEYFSAPLENDPDESWWSIVYPEVLVLAARRALEVAHRNNQGVQEFEQRINSRLGGIDSNVAEQQSSNSGQMTNAW